MGPTVRREFVVAEHHGLSPPASASPAEVTQFWVAANCARWAAALVTETASGYAVCDADPLKLHYHYCCARIGAIPWDLFRTGVGSYRRAIADHAIGIADLIMCSVPDETTLGQRKRDDSTRSRRNFDLHRQLGAPLRDWYAALDRIDPGRVRWDYPDDLPQPAVRDRYDTALFDDWMASLASGVSA